MASRSVIAVVCGLLVASCGGDTTTSTTPESTSTTANTSTPASPWTRLADSDGALGGSGYQEMQDLVSTPDGLVAIGSDGTEAGFEGAVWTFDGETWTRVPDPSGVFAGASLRTVTAAGPGFVTAGFVRSDGDTDAVIFYSADGANWQRVADGTGALGGDSTQTINQVIAGGPGLVAVGSDYSGDDTDAAVWLSVDGIVWERLSDPGMALPGHQAMLGVIATAAGLLAVGSDDADGDLDAALWVSTDGRSWSQVEDESFGGAGLQRMVAIAAAGPGLVAVGAADGSDGLDAALWVSADGTAWDRVIDPSFGGVGDQVVQTVAAWGTGMILVGHEFLPDTLEFDAVVWQSADGVTWERVTDAVFGGTDMQILQGVIVTGELVIVTGVSGTEAEADAAVWVRAAS